MPKLLFEIWRDDDGSHAMSPVRRENDELRQKIAPNSVLVHSYYASTDFEAFRLKNEWQGFAPWMPEPDWEERPFTD